LTNSSPAQIAHVIFDVDGTLVNNLNLIVKSFNFAVQGIMGRTFSQKEVHSRFGPTLEEMIVEVVPREKAIEAVQNYHSFYKKHFHQYAQVYSGIKELVSGLREANIRLSAYTGSDARMTKTTLEETGLSDEFSVVVTADDIHRQKPDPEGLIIAMKLTTEDPARTIYLGDAARDIEASKRAGIRSATALWGFNNPRDLKDHKPDFAFNNPHEALECLTNPRGRFN
jgi:HAD superfamily hydrolase (TIGR01549 family)